MSKVLDVLTDDRTILRDATGHFKLYFEDVAVVTASRSGVDPLIL